MNDLSLLGKTIKDKRLSLNMRMEDVAKKADITRATLWSIEKGSGNCSTKSLFRVLNVLNLSLNIVNQPIAKNIRNRATRKNLVLDKKINRFVVMCIELYAEQTNQSGYYAFSKMKSAGVIEELVNDYEDLHGMSSEYLNDYIEALMKE